MEVKQSISLVNPPDQNYQIFTEELELFEGQKSRSITEIQAPGTEQINQIQAELEKF